MFTIHKHHLVPNQTTCLHLPKGAIVLSAKCDREGKVTMWEMHDDDVTENEFFRFKVLGTGFKHPNPLDDGLEFLDTVVLHSGFTWHVFWRKG